MVVFIYLRHGQKCYDNLEGLRNEKYFKEAFDSPIKPGQEEFYQNYSNSLVQKYGIPDRIYCSPFLRCRQTARLMNVNFHVDSLLGEYLGDHSNRMNVLNHLNPSTKRYRIYIDHNDKQFFNRCRRHLELRNEVKEGVIWFITHGYNISVFKQDAIQNNYTIDQLNGIDIAIKK